MPCGAATKMNDAEAVRQAIAAGVDCCGENRVQELVQKSGEDAYRGAPVHFIGHLQTNKVRQVVGHVDLIQSADRWNLLEALEKEAARQGICQKVLLEVNIAGEESKSRLLSGVSLGGSGRIWRLFPLAGTWAHGNPPCEHPPGRKFAIFF